jgi:hypothetical protein
MKKTQKGKNRVKLKNQKVKPNKIYILAHQTVKKRAFISQTRANQANRKAIRLSSKKFDIFCV